MEGGTLSQTMGELGLPPQEAILTCRFLTTVLDLVWNFPSSLLMKGENCHLSTDLFYLMNEFYHYLMTE